MVSAQDTLAERMIGVERDGRIRARPIFDERIPRRRAVEVRVELVGPEERGSLLVEHLESVGEGAAVPANGEVPLPIREKTAPFARVAGDRIVNASALDGASEFDAQALPQLRQRGIERQAGEGAPARA